MIDETLKNWIDLDRVPFTDRGSRILVMRHGKALAVRLAERWFKVDKRLSAYRHRLPILDDFYLTGAEGEVLDYVMESYPHRVDFHTRIGNFSLTFVDAETLLFYLPDCACGVSFRANMTEGQTDRRGGVLRVTGDIRRNIAYSSNRELLENSVQEVEPNYLRVKLRFAAGKSGGLLLNPTPRLGFNRYVPDLETAFARAAQRWEDYFASLPRVDGRYEDIFLFAWWIMRVGLISTRFFITREAMTPSKIHYVGVWQWDAYFHALAYRHLEPLLARDQLRVMLDHQRADGMIPDAVHDEGTITHLSFPVDADVTKPPLLAWAAWKLYEKDGDREFLNEIYEGVVRWNRWWLEKNDLDGDGLCEYLHPFSSGLDDSPLWDGGVPVTSPDLNAYLVVQMEALGRMAQVLGLPDEAQDWEQKAQALLERMVQYLWDDETGLFLARRGGEFVRIRTVVSLLPLVTGRLPRDIAARLVQHLTNPDEFWAAHPVTTVARNDPNYNPEQMWRGPVWVNTNYLLIEGLRRSGFAEVADRLREATLDLLAAHTDIYEYYQPETGQPCPKAATIFGWSAALLIDLLLD